MTQTILMGAAAAQFVLMACMVNAQRPFHIAIFQVAPALLSLGLAVMAFGRFMGWPV